MMLCTYATLKVLEHGPLAFGELRQITPAGRRTCPHLHAALPDAEREDSATTAATAATAATAGCVCAPASTTTPAIRAQHENQASILDRTVDRCAAPSVPHRRAAGVAAQVGRDMCSVYQKAAVLGLVEHLASAESALQTFYRRAPSAQGRTAPALHFHEHEAV